MANILDSLYAKTGGFIKGICHPNDNYELLKNAGLNWVRTDIPYPFDKDGNVSNGYKAYKERCLRFAENGIGYIIVTPYPDTFIEHGIDVTTEEGLKQAGEVCAFIAKDYAGIRTCWQITNEMHIRHFRAPLNEDQAEKFIIACMKGFKAGNPDLPVGHNSVDRSWLDRCINIEKECDCDFTGVDIYDGTWYDGGVDTYVPWIEELYETLKKPVIVMEFGFASVGGLVEDPKGERDAYVQKLGFKDYDDAIAHKDEFIKTFPEDIQKRLNFCVPEDQLGLIHVSMLHVLKKWMTDCTIPHTEEGQAQFYRELLPKLLNCECVAGAVLYCLRDSRECFFCGQDDCPCETAWGLVRLDGSIKPAYDAVKEVFTK